ncbi:MAG: hypothetical protein RMA76_34575 [Deltaproteobacteria bacterium]|jgi:hypothetical protein
MTDDETTKILRHVERQTEALFLLIEHVLDPSEVSRKALEHAHYRLGEAMGLSEEQSRIPPRGP